MVKYSRLPKKKENEKVVHLQSAVLASVEGFFFISEKLLKASRHIRAPGNAVRGFLGVLETI